MGTSRFVWSTLLCTALAVGAASVARAEQGGAAPTCDQVLAAMEEAGGSRSPDEVAKKLGTSPAHVRHCMSATEGGKNPAPVRQAPAPGEPTKTLK